VSGWVVVLSPCFGCGRTFGYNPHLVPSVVVQGDRQPVCADCVERVNPRRVANGLEPIRPLPSAYEPLQAEEL